MNKFLCSIPRMEILCSHWFYLDEFLHLFFIEKIVTIIYRLITHTYLWHFHYRTLPIVYKHIRRLHQVCINVSYFSYFIVVVKTALCITFVTKTHNNTMDMSFLLCFAIPSERAMSKVDAQSVFYHRFPKISNLLALTNTICRNKSSLRRCPFY